MAIIVAGRRVFRMWNEEGMVALCGSAPDLIDESDYFDWADARLGPIDEDEYPIRHPMIGVFEYDDIWVPGSLFVVTIEVHPSWRHRGIATLLINGARVVFPRLLLLADRASGNTAAGNAFIDAYNAREGDEAIHRWRRGEGGHTTGYQAVPDEMWPTLARRFLPRD